MCFGIALIPDSHRDHCGVRKKHASLLLISRALHLIVFDQPEKTTFSETW
jgi:hypothetical protein